MSQLGYDLQIQRGASVRQPFLLQRPDPVFKRIETIGRDSPISLTATAHGVPEYWPVWIEEVVGDQTISRGRNFDPVFLSRVDANTLEVPGTDGFGRAASGGVIVYQPPYDLTGAVVRVEAYDPAELLVATWTVGDGLEVNPQGLVSLVLTGVQTRAIAWDNATYEMTVDTSGGETLFYEMGNLMAVGRGAP